MSGGFKLGEGKRMIVTIEATTELTPFRLVKPGQRFLFDKTEYLKIFATPVHSTSSGGNARDCVNMARGELAWFSNKDTMVELRDRQEVTFSSLATGALYFQNGNPFLKTGLTTAFDVQNHMGWEIETLDMMVEPAVNAELKVYRRFYRA